MLDVSKSNNNEALPLFVTFPVRDISEIGIYVRSEWSKRLLCNYEKISSLNEKNKQC